MTKQGQKSTYAVQFSIIAILFAIFGFVTWLNGILIPFLKKLCQLTDQQSFLVATAFFAAYFILPLPSSWILGRTGTKKGMAFGLGVMAAGALIFIPAASMRSFEVFLTGLFFQGMGLALLQTAANPYVSIIGPVESAAQRISIMGICNKTAGIVSNLLFGSILLADIKLEEAPLEALAARVATPYTVMALILALVALVILRSSLPDIKTQTGDSETEDTPLSAGKTSIFQFPHVFLGALAIFFYVGAEVMAGDLITTYGKNLQFSDDVAKLFTTYNLIGLIVGYLVSIVLVPKFIKQEKWLMLSAILGIVLTLASYYTSEYTAVFCLAALGFANAVMWPAIFPLGIKNIGRFTNVGSAILVMGIVGGALIPPFYGWLYENSRTGLDFRSAFVVVMLACYGYILWFGEKGHKKGDIKS